MCTCITYDNGSFYFGRNLDLDGSFGETVTVTPRNFTLYFRRAGRMERSMRRRSMKRGCAWQG